MLIDIVDKDLNQAAKKAAGNWKKWTHFAWFGADDVPDNHNVCLLYLVNNSDPTITQLSNAAVVKEKLQQWFGNNTTNSLVAPFHSSVSGDANVLSGIQIRVYDSKNNITEPFKVLYELALLHKEQDVLDQKKFEEINKSEFIKYLTINLPNLCEENDFQYNENLPQIIFDILKDMDEHRYDYLFDFNIENALQEYIESL